MKRWQIALLQRMKHGTLTPQDETFLSSVQVLLPRVQAQADA